MRGAVGAKVGRLIRFKDSPDPSLCGAEDSNKVMHMTFQIGDQTIMASDGQCQGIADVPRVCPITHRDR